MVKPIALISAVPFEADRLGLGSIRNLRAHTPVQAQIQQRPVVYISSGIGATNAAHAATVIIERYSPSLVIVFGIGGAYPHTGLRVGDVAAASKEIYADTGIMLKEGFRGMKEMGFPLIKKGRRVFYNEFPLDKELLRKAVSTGIASGTFLTVSACTGSLRRALELKKLYNPIVENMEGAAVAQICCLYEVPLLEIRGISNIVEDRNMGKWDKTSASRNCQNALLEILKLL